ncbi:MAG: cysteine--tRNA ligase [Candidatus Brocadiia bacterium]
MKVFNTYTRRKEEFEPIEPGKVRMYNCGPTVYNFAHIGNARAFVFADVLRRTLEHFGCAVTQIMNITDVGHMTSDADEGEDKMAKAAREQQKDPWQIAEFYTKAFLEDIRALNIEPAFKYPRATEHIPEMIALIERLIGNGHAYAVNGNVYYDIAAFPRYGRLSGNTIEQLEAGARIEINPEKRHPADFALWKQDPKHIMQWDSPWGRGFPGWHIECSAMSGKYLGDQFDIHTGAEDNIFPHHESEIAQSEGATGKVPWVKYWMHARFLQVNGQKMSKSLGNFFTLRDLLEKGCDPMAVRYVLISTHYRQPLNFTLESVEAAKTSIRRLKDFRIRLKESGAKADPPELAAALEKGKNGFDAALADDLNTSAALAALFDMLRDVNKLELSPAGAAQAAALLASFDKVMGVLGEEKEESPDAEIESLIRRREEARARRDFKTSDDIRTQLKAKGIILEDSAGGTRWKRA